MNHHTSTENNCVLGRGNAYLRINELFLYRFQPNGLQEQIICTIEMGQGHFLALKIDIDPIR